LKNLKKTFQQLQRLRLSPSKKADKVWNDLKKFFNESDLKVGVHEKDKYVQLYFAGENEDRLNFVNYVENEFLVCRCTCIDSYPVELTTDIFILATHFNNLLNYGKVVIDVNRKTINYLVKTDLIVPLLNPESINTIFNSHYITSNDIYFAYNRLIYEGEAPAIIIADLLKQNNNNSDEKN
jgi:hypothetical protein